MSSDTEPSGEDDVRPKVWRPQGRVLEEHGSERPWGDGSHPCVLST